jgi:hypothetical protein
MNRVRERAIVAVIATLFSSVSSAQEKTFEIRGSVVMRDGGYPDLDVSLRGKGGAAELKTVTDLSGAFSFSGVPSGQYVLQVGHFYPVVPPPPFLEVALNVGRSLTLLLPMDTDSFPHHFCHLDRGSDKDLGVLSGSVKGKGGSPIEGANVALYISKLGRIASTRTKRGGSFSFPQLRIGGDYWVHVFNKGYFDDEITGVKVLAGYESIYDGLTLEPCEPGHCESHLRPIHIAPLN